MALFDFFKKLIKTEKKADEEQEIYLNTIEKWLDENTKELSLEFVSEVNGHFERIAEGVKEIEEGLNELKNFNLNKDINERAKTMILQNKDNYIKYTERLIDFFKKSNSMEKNVKNVENFIKLSLWEIDMFSRQSTRSFHISSELIGKEFEKVIIGLKKINNEIIDLRRMDRTNMRIVESIRALAGEIKSLEGMTSRLNAADTDAKNRIKDLDRKTEELKDREKKLKGSKEWLKKQELRDQLDSLENQQEKAQVEVKDLFMAIEKLIQKYAWKEKKKDILLYVEDPISALKEDDGLKILDEIDVIRKEIDENVFTFDEKKKQQFLDSVNKITEKALLDFLEKDMKFNDERKSIVEEMKAIKTEDLNFLEIEDKKAEAEEEISKISRKKVIVEREIGDKKKSLGLLVEDLGAKIGKPVKSV